MKMQYPVMLIVILLVLGGKVVVSIEVYENINENGTDSEAPLKSTLPNSVVSNGSQLAINEPGKGVSVTTSAVDYTRNDSGSGNQQQPAVDNHRHQQKQQHHKHSPSYRDTPLPITPATTVVSVTTSTSKGSPSVVLSSAASPTASSGSAFKEDSVLKDIVGANLVQQQISGYKKRQLYANAFQVAKNGTNERSYEKQRNRQLSKEFIPSPELTHFSPNAEDHRPFQPGPAVDATYPASPVDNDSKWFGANHISIPESYHEHVPPKYEHHKSGKYLWLPNGPSNHNIPSSDSPFSRTKSRLPSPPKGKWKWVPEDEDASDVPQQTEKPMESAKAPDLESKIISGGHYFLGHLPPRDHPYSFDAGQTPFSADGVGSGGGAVSTASSSSTTIDPLMYFFGPSTTAVVDTGKQKTGAKGDSDALKGVSPWKKIIHVLSAAIPIGLIISALTPQVVYINPNMTQNPIQMQTPTPIGATGGASSSFTNPSRQRSEDQISLIGTSLANPLIGFLNALSASPKGDLSRWPNFGALFGAASSGNNSSACEEKSFCEMARQGINHDADILFKMLWKIANETPADQARQSGLEEIFRAVKDDDCSRFHCEST